MSLHYLRCPRTISRLCRSLVACAAIGSLLCPPAVGSATGTAGAIEYDSHDENVADSITGGAITPPWGTGSAEAGNRFGYSVSGAGDVNGDGYSDIIVGEPPANLDAGGAYVFHFSVSGTGEVVNVLAWAAEGERAGDNLGISVAGAGDVNGDGYSDIVVGANGYNHFQGKVYVFYGSAIGITGTAASPAWSAEGESPGDHFGGSVSGAGDVNGDGYDDIVVGASGTTDAMGRAYVFLGSGNGIIGTAANPVWSTDGETAGDRFGQTVAGSGDVNGDGYDDIIIAAPYANSNTGKVYVFHGSASGITGTAGAPAWSATGEAADSVLGLSAADAGDVNGDSYDDIVVSAPGMDSSMGRVYVFNGSAGGISGDVANSAWSADGETASDSFGQSVSGAGDVNRDGYGDIVVGASGYGSNSGKTYVFQGGAGGITGTAASPVWDAVGDAVGDELGGSVSGAGDVNRDGYSDIVVGAAGHNSGVGIVYPGHAFTPALTVTTIGIGTVTSDPAGINCGMTCTAEISYGTPVTLTATAGSGNRFIGWGGACSGTHGCVVTMDGSKSITAYFVRYWPHVYLPAVRKP